MDNSYYEVRVEMLASKTFRIKAPTMDEARSQMNRLLCSYEFNKIHMQDGFDMYDHIVADVCEDEHYGYDTVDPKDYLD